MHNRTILLVEDNMDDIELTKIAMERHGIANRIDIVMDGVEALHYLHDNPEAQLPALVLLDLKLPRLDGIGVLRQIRLHPRTQYLPVVILTSSGEERDVLESYKLGANSYVRKPVDFPEFLEASRQLGMYWLLVNRRPGVKE